MNRQLALAVGGLMAVAGCAHNTQVAGGMLAPATPVSNTWLPAGAVLDTRLNQSIGTKSSREGEAISATVVNPLIAQDGSVAIPAGAVLDGTITGLHHAGFPTEQAVIRVNFDRLRMNGRSYPFSGVISDVNVENRGNTLTSAATSRAAVTGAVAGAALGTIFTGGALSGLVTGGLLGAGAGTAVSLGVGNAESFIPEGSRMQVQATQGVRLR